MSTQLSRGAEATIRESVERGDSSDAEAVAGVALRVLAERDQSAELKAAIAVGMEQLERARSYPGRQSLLTG